MRKWRWSLFGIKVEVGVLGEPDPIAVRAMNRLLLALGREAGAWIRVQSGATRELSIAQGGELQRYGDVASVLAVALPEDDPERDERPDDLFERMGDRLEEMANLLALDPTLAVDGTVEVIEHESGGERSVARFSVARSGDGATRFVTVRVIQPFLAPD